MCNGIAVLVYEKDKELKGLCTGISSHDELCKLDDDLRYGKIEPYRFELLYPCNLVYDRGHNKPTELGICKEQPKKEIWDIAFEISSAYRMSHTKHQLMYAYLRGADLEGADLREANLEGADLRGADLEGAKLEGTIYSKYTIFTKNLDKSRMINK